MSGATGYKSCHFVLRDSLQSREISDLCLQRVVGTIEPEPLWHGTMNPERSAESVAELLSWHFVLLRKDLNSIRQPDRVPRGILCQS